MNEKQYQEKIIPPSPEKDETASHNEDIDPLEKKARGKFELAKAIGISYEKLIGGLLSGNPEEVMEEAVESLPELARPLFRKGVAAFEGERLRNAEKMRNFSGSYLSLIVGLEMESLDDDTKEEMSDTVTFDSPSEGIYILGVDPEVLRAATKDDPIVPASFDYMMVTAGDDTPSYVLYNKTRNDGRADGSAKKVARLRHELSHLLWSHLEDSGFSRNVEEDEKEEAWGFGAFRHEAIAYIVSDGFGATLRDVRYMVYSEDEGVKEKAEESMKLLEMGLKFAQMHGREANSLIYPIASSRTFEELDDRIADFTKLDVDDLALLIDTMYSRLDFEDMDVHSPTSKLAFDEYRSAAKRMVIRNKDQFTKEQITDFSDTKIEEAIARAGLNAKTLSEARSGVRRVTKILNDLFVDSYGAAGEIDAVKELDNNLSLPLPAETVNVILSFDTPGTTYIPLGLSGYEFVYKLVAMNIDDSYIGRSKFSPEETGKMLSAVISSSPELSSEFASVKSKLSAEKELELEKIQDPTYYQSKAVKEVISGRYKVALGILEKVEIAVQQ